MSNYTYVVGRFCIFWKELDKVGFDLRFEVSDRWDYREEKWHSDDLAIIYFAASLSCLYEHKLLGKVFFGCFKEKSPHTHQFALGGSYLKHLMVDKMKKWFQTQCIIKEKWLCTQTSHTGETHWISQLHSGIIEDKCLRQTLFLLETLWQLFPAVLVLLKQSFVQKK